jgi:hypothetical protein
MLRFEIPLNPFGHRKTDDGAAVGACHHAHAHYFGCGKACCHGFVFLSSGFVEDMIPHRTPVVNTNL